MTMTLRFILLFWIWLSSLNGAGAFEAQSSWGGTATGSANELTVTINNVTKPGDLLGVPIRFIAATDNTGPVTVAVGGTSAIPLKRPSSIGNVDLSGAELKAGEMASVTFNGSVYILTSNVDMTPIGRTVEFRGSVTPRGTLIEDGSCAVSRTTYAALFNVIGTNYGAGDGTTTFCLPDSRGRAFTALDTQGNNGPANLITPAGSGCNATVVGSCGQQNNSLVTANLPPYTPAGSISGSVTGSVSSTVNDPGHQHAMGIGFAAGGGSGGTYATGGPNSTGASVTGVTVSSSMSAGFSGSFSGSSQGGTSAAFTNLMPISLGRRAIKY